MKRRSPRPEGMKPNQIESAQDIMRRYPCLTAHLIAESLGYATPTKAALIIRDAKYREQNWCEWIAACYQSDPQEAVRDAFRHRHHHRGYMAKW